MDKLIRILIFIIINFQLTISFGQHISLDTVFVKRTIDVNEVEIDTLFIPGGRSSQQVLVGTMFLPYSDKIINLINSGFSPISLEIIEECNNKDPKYFKDYPKLISTAIDSNTLTIDVSVIANCCHNFLGEAEIREKNTLNLVYTSYGGFCSCSCCFTLRYKLGLFDEKTCESVKYITVNGSESIGGISKIK